MSCGDVNGAEILNKVCPLAGLTSQLGISTCLPRRYKLKLFIPLLIHSERFFAVDIEGRSASHDWLDWIRRPHTIGQDCPHFSGHPPRLRPSRKQRDFVTSHTPATPARAAGSTATEQNLIGGQLPHENYSQCPLTDDPESQRLVKPARKPKSDASPRRRTDASGAYAVTQDIQTQTLADYQ